MARKRRLMRREITFSSASKKETDILHALSFYPRSVNFFTRLQSNLSLIQQAAAYHLRLSPEACFVPSDFNDWHWGSFNVCIPVTVAGRRRALIRFPLPHRVGELFRPGNADEKIRCEAGTYAWLQENCPSVPIPKLHGFALSTGQTFTAIENLPVIPRYIEYIRRLVSRLLAYPLPSTYVPRRTSITQSLAHAVGTGYILIDYIEDADGTMLSRTWEDRRSDARLRTNLYRGLSRILLDMARVPLPRIGSFIIDDHGYIQLSNRPFTLEIADMENCNIPLTMPRDVTFSSADSYLASAISLHDNRLRHQPNGAIDQRDCIDQMSALTMFRVVAPRLFRAELSRGPFVYMLNDLHRSNILVDKDWNIKYVIDLEWACAKPIEMLHPPEWLTSQAVDEIDDDAYNTQRLEFMSVLQEEEQRVCGGSDNLSKTMHQGWSNGTFWYSLALQSPTGIFSIFYDRIQPRFERGHATDPNFYRISYPYFTTDAHAFIAHKLQQRADYDKQLRTEFDMP
ncbi:hypothetical protein TMEN_8635 [Trichophyton mentagrophytes]|nr:hypothetical protein TMEN_8635 [Trichophyton mentagrophytes]